MRPGSALRGPEGKFGRRTGDTTAPGYAHGSTRAAAKTARTDRTAACAEALTGEHHPRRARSTAAAVSAAADRWCAPPRLRRPCDSGARAFDGFQACADSSSRRGQCGHRAARLRTGGCARACAAAASTTGMPFHPQVETDSWWPACVRITSYSVVLLAYRTAVARESRFSRASVPASIVGASVLPGPVEGDGLAGLAGAVPGEAEGTSLVGGGAAPRWRAGRGRSRSGEVGRLYAGDGPGWWGR